MTIASFLSHFLSPELLLTWHSNFQIYSYQYLGASDLQVSYSIETLRAVLGQSESVLKNKIKSAGMWLSSGTPALNA